MQTSANIKIVNGIRCYTANNTFLFSLSDAIEKFNLDINTINNIPVIKTQQIGIAIDFSSLLKLSTGVENADFLNLPNINCSNTNNYVLPRYRYIHNQSNISCHVYSSGLANEPEREKESSSVIRESEDSYPEGGTSGLLDRLFETTRRGAKRKEVGTREVKIRRRDIEEIKRRENLDELGGINELDEFYSDDYYIQFKDIKWVDKIFNISQSFRITFSRSLCRFCDTHGYPVKRRNCDNKVKYPFKGTEAFREFIDRHPKYLQHFRKAESTC